MNNKCSEMIQKFLESLSPEQRGMFVAIAISMAENTDNHQVVHTSAEDPEKTVTSIFREIGVPANIKGYQYMRMAILLVYEDPDYIEHVTKRLYPTVAKLYKTTPTRVERAIRHAIEVVFTHGDQENLYKYCTCSCHKGKPTNSEFIAVIVDWMKLH